MPDHPPLPDRGEVRSPGQFPALPTVEQEIAAIYFREELLLRAHLIACRIQERVWKAMGKEGLGGPHERRGSEAKR